MIFHTRLLVLAAQFAVARLLGSRCVVGAERDNQHEQNGNGSHDHLLSGHDATRCSHESPPPVAPAEQNRMHLSVGKNRPRAITSTNRAVRRAWTGAPSSGEPAFSPEGNLSGWWDRFKRVEFRNLPSDQVLRRQLDGTDHPTRGCLTQFCGGAANSRTAHGRA